MGNVHAFSAPPPPPPNSGMSFPKQAEEKNESEKIENPGPLDEIHNKCKSMLFFEFILHASYHFIFSDIFPTCFEGARVMLTRGLSNHFQISHTINMSSVTPSGYRFGATYVGTKQLSPTEAFPILLGDIDPSGNLNATIIHQICTNVQAKFGAQV